MNTKEDRTIYVKCPTCLARFTGKHTCDPLMKILRNPDIIKNAFKLAKEEMDKTTREADRITKALNKKPWLTKSGKVKSSWLKKNAKFSHGLTYPK